MSTTERRPVEPLDPELHGRVSARLHKHLNMLVAPDQVEADVADTVLNETLLYLWLIATYSNRLLPPSALVDEGWHALIVYTQEYEAYCKRTYGETIHHAPDDIPGAPPMGATVADTVKFMRERRIPYNADMWPDDDDAKCSKPSCQKPHCGRTPICRRGAA